MAQHGHYEDAVTTLSRNEDRKARVEQAKREDRRAAAAQARLDRRSI